MGCTPQNKFLFIYYYFVQGESKGCQYNVQCYVKPRTAFYFVSLDMPWITAIYKRAARKYSIVGSSVRREVWTWWNGADLTARLPSERSMTTSRLVASGCAVPTRCTWCGSWSFWTRRNKEADKSLPVEEQWLIFWDWTLLLSAERLGWPKNTVDGGVRSRVLGSHLCSVGREMCGLGCEIQG